MMEIDPINKLKKLSKSLLLPFICSTTQHLFSALSLQSVTSSCRNILFVKFLWQLLWLLFNNAYFF